MREETKKESRAKKRRRRAQNRIAMASITFVVCILLAVLLVQGASLREKISSNSAKKTEIQKEIDQEEERTTEIDELKEYMQSDEYAEKAARDKLGLVKDNEIVFKEEK